MASTTPPLLRALEQGVLIRPLGDDYALVLGIQSFGQPGENGTSDVIRMKYQSIWHRGDDGVWRRP